MTNEEAVSLAKSKFSSVAETAINAAILASPLSILETPPFSILTHEAVHWAITAIANDAELAVFFEYINFNVNQEGHDFIQAVYQNQQAQLGGTDVQKQTAEKNLEDSFAKLIVVTN